MPVLDENPVPVLRRLVTWLAPFKGCFGHRAQAVSLGHYVAGLLSDSPRKSMQAMLARVSAPPDYHTPRHFITHAPWSAARMWRVLGAQLSERRGVLLPDDTGFPKEGDHSVGVARQYTGSLGKIGNCQVAGTAALRTGVRAWLVGAGRTYPGWAHHVVVSAVACAFLQRERMHRDTPLTFEAVRTIVQEIFAGLPLASRPRYADWVREAQ